MPRLRSKRTGVVVNVDARTASSLGSEWVDANAAPESKQAESTEEPAVPEVSVETVPEAAEVLPEEKPAKASKGKAAKAVAPESKQD